MAPQFNPREQLFISRIMKTFEQMIKSNPNLELDLLENVLNKQLRQGNCTTDAGKMVEAILTKIAMSKADNEIEKMLTDPNYGNDYVPNTKAKSLAQVTNITEKHNAILRILQRFPDSSRREVAQHLGRPINEITPRCKELLEMDYIEVSGVKHDYSTDRKVQRLNVVHLPKGEQIDNPDEGK